MPRPDRADIRLFRWKKLFFARTSCAAAAARSTQKSRRVQRTVR